MPVLIYFLGHHFTSERSAANCIGVRGLDTKNLLQTLLWPELL